MSELPFRIIGAFGFPDLDEWGPDEYDSAASWVQWHRDMVVAYGAEQATQRFLDLYHKNSWGSVAYKWRLFDPAFRSYAKDNGFYEALFQNIGGYLDRLIAAIFSSTVESGSGAIEQTTGAVESAAKVLRVLVPVFVAVLFVGVGLYLYRRFFK